MNSSFLSHNKGKVAICLLLGLLSGFLADHARHNFPFAFADSAIHLTMDSASNISPGASADLNIYIDPTSAPQQLASLQFDLLYNPADVASIAWKSNGQAALAAGKSGICSTPSAGDFRCLVVGFNTTTISQGTLGTITVTLAGSTTAVNVPLHFSNLLGSSASGQAISAVGTDGTITVQQPQTHLPPVVAIIQPAGGASVSGSGVVVSASATAANGSITSVKFYLDNSAVLGMAYSSPYAITWDTTAYQNGSHTLTALATDSLNNSAVSSGVAVVISNSVISPLTCQASGSTNINIGQSVTFAVSGGQGNYALSAPGATVNGLTATFNSAGDYSVSASDALGHQASCGSVHVSQQLNATCGTAGGASMASAPSGSSLCSTGTASAVTGSGPWTWECYGQSGGTNASCSASLANTCVQPIVGSAYAPSTVNPGQHFTLSCDFGNANAFIATPANCNQWTGDNGTVANFDCTAPNSGSATYTCAVANHAGFANFCSLPLPVSTTVTVNIQQTNPLSCSASPSTVNTLQTVTVTASGGSGIYTFFEPGAISPDLTNNSVSIMYPGSGLQTVTVSDSQGRQASCNVNVLSQQPTTFTASATASASASCPDGSVTSATASASATSSISQQDAQNNAQTAAQTDAQNQAAAKCPAVQTLSCLATGSMNINSGGSVSFQGSGGSGNYSLTASGASVSGLTAAFGSAGSYPISLSDTAGHSANCGTVVVIQPAATTYTATASATGTASATASCPDGSVASASATANASASATSDISQQDAQNKAQTQAQANAQAQAQNNAQSQANAKCTQAARPLSCSASQSSVNLNQVVVFTAAGGNGSYFWSGGGNSSSGNGASFNTSYATSGNHTATVSSSDGQTASCSVFVLPQTIIGDTNPPVNIINSTITNTCVNYSCNYIYNSEDPNVNPNSANSQNVVNFQNLNNSALLPMPDYNNNAAISSPLAAPPGWPANLPFPPVPNFVRQGILPWLGH